MKNFYILDDRHVIDLNEIQAIEFCHDAPITSDGKYRIKILFRGSDIRWFDVPQEAFNKFSFKMMQEDRIC